ncbi:hypothetical protein Nepgr_022844 [Nepenthes gracilis]|uniref:Uncharacterized protein n=1 Tax=Nepenthes gracilis TaxID=150966 RepID=A0AAD3T2T3_NEPGR|nr:hypothetical protein Nepgr_022844 [Nepenthes gracilis]
MRMESKLGLGIEPSAGFTANVLAVGVLMCSIVGRNQLLLHLSLLMQMCPAVCSRTGSLLTLTAVLIFAGSWLQLAFAWRMIIFWMQVLISLDVESAAVLLVLHPDACIAGLGVWRVAVGFWCCWSLSCLAVRLWTFVCISFGYQEIIGDKAVPPITSPRRAQEETSPQSLRSAREISIKSGATESLRPKCGPTSGTRRFKRQICS